MPDFLMALATAGAVLCFVVFPFLLLTFGVLLMRAARRGEAGAGAVRVGGWLMGAGALSLALYLAGGLSRLFTLGWVAVALTVLAAALCGVFLRRPSTRPLRLVSWVLFGDTLLVAAFLPFALWTATVAVRMADRIAAYDNPNEPEVRAALVKNPNDAAAHSSLARIDSHRGDHAGEMAEWRQVLRVEPDNLDTLLLVGWRLTQEGKVDEARPLFQRLAARHDQFSASAREWLARHGG